MRLLFTWKDDVIDHVDIDDEALSSQVAFVSIHAPPKLAASPSDVIEQELIIRDGDGRRYLLDVESAGASSRYPTINGYLRPAFAPDDTTFARMG